MQFEDVSINLLVRIREEDLDAHLPFSLSRIGHELAAMCNDYANKHGTGYYPALEFFTTLDDSVADDGDKDDQNLLALADQAAWLSSKLVREAIQRKLRPVFASVRFQSIQTVAYALPPVRPQSENALAALAEHYTPDTFRLELQLTMMRKDTDTREGRAETYARKMIYRWLKDSFRHVEILASQS